MRYRIPLLWIGFVLVVALGIVGYILTMPTNTPALPRETNRPVPTSIISTGEVPVPTAPAPTPEPTMSVSTAVPVIGITGSTPTKLYVPRLKKTVVLASKTCPVVSVDGQAMLDPDRSDFTKACYFVGKGYPYVLPSTNAPDIAVLAGHTGRTVPNAAFNIFYNWKKGVFTLKPGDEIWIQTKASGSQWLVYKATDLLTPKKYASDKKVSLMNDPKVWGTAPTPGVLITIGCLQPMDFSQHSTENIVIKWQFSRVEK